MSSIRYDLVNSNLLVTILLFLHPDSLGLHILNNSVSGIIEFENARLFQGDFFKIAGIVVILNAML